MKRLAGVGFLICMMHVSCEGSTPRPLGSKAEALTRGGEALAKVPSFSDEVLVDHHGKSWRLASELLRGNVVVVDFIYSRCTAICSPMTAILVKTQKQLQERGVGDVRFVSISLDPAYDTPERLRVYADEFGAGPGFHFLTGEVPAVERVLREFQAYPATKETHSPVFVVGNQSLGAWRRLHGLVPPSAIADVAQALRQPEHEGVSTP